MHFELPFKTHIRKSTIGFRLLLHALYLLLFRKTIGDYRRNREEAKFWRIVVIGLAMSGVSRR
jgi:uncharacterized protein YhhL (DUF1145 family)